MTSSGDSKTRDDAKDPLDAAREFLFRHAMHADAPVVYETKRTSFAATADEQRHDAAFFDKSPVQSDLPEWAAEVALDLKDRLDPGAIAADVRRMVQFCTDRGISLDGFSGLPDSLLDAEESIPAPTELESYRAYIKEMLPTVAKYLRVPADIPPPSPKLLLSKLYSFSDDRRQSLLDWVDNHVAPVEFTEMMPFLLGDELQLREDFFSMKTKYLSVLDKRTTVVASVKASDAPVGKDPQRSEARSWRRADTDDSKAAVAAAAVSPPPPSRVSEKLTVNSSPSVSFLWLFCQLMLRGNDLQRDPVLSIYAIAQNSAKLPLYNSNAKEQAAFWKDAPRQSMPIGSIAVTSLETLAARDSRVFSDAKHHALYLDAPTDVWDSRVVFYAMTILRDLSSTLSWDINRDRKGSTNPLRWLTQAGNRTWRKEGLHYKSGVRRHFSDLYHDLEKIVGWDYATLWDAEQVDGKALCLRRSWLDSKDGKPELNAFLALCSCSASVGLPLDSAVRFIKSQKIQLKPPNKTVAAGALAPREWFGVALGRLLRYVYWSMKAKELVEYLGSLGAGKVLDQYRAEVKEFGVPLLKAGAFFEKPGSLGKDFQHPSPLCVHRPSANDGITKLDLSWAAAENLGDSVTLQVLSSLTMSTDALAGAIDTHLSCVSSVLCAIQLFFSDVISMMSRKWRSTLTDMALDLASVALQYPTTEKRVKLSGIYFTTAVDANCLTAFGAKRHQTEKIHLTDSLLAMDEPEQDRSLNPLCLCTRPTMFKLKDQLRKLLRSSSGAQQWFDAIKTRLEMNILQAMSDASSGYSSTTSLLESAARLVEITCHDALWVLLPLVWEDIQTLEEKTKPAKDEEWFGEDAIKNLIKTKDLSAWPQASILDKAFSLTAERTFWLAEHFSAEKLVTESSPPEVKFCFGMRKHVREAVARVFQANNAPDTEEDSEDEYPHSDQDEDTELAQLTVDSLSVGSASSSSSCSQFAS